MPKRQAEGLSPGFHKRAPKPAGLLERFAPAQDKLLIPSPILKEMPLVTPMASKVEIAGATHSCLVALRAAASLSCALRLLLKTVPLLAMPGS